MRYAPEGIHEKQAMGPLGHRGGGGGRGLAAACADGHPRHGGPAPRRRGPDGSRAGGGGAVAPLNSLSPVGPDYRISPNDLMEFNVFGVPDMKRDVRVNASGQVSLPLIGPVQVAGLTSQDAEQLIATKYREKYLRDPQVSLFIKEFTTQRVAIEGAVTKPGIYPVSGQLTLLRALALSGGFAPYANINQIVVYS